MGKSFEQLFLLEVLVERITLRRSILEKYYTTQEDASIPLSVKVKFIDFPYLEINQEDFRSQESLDAATVGDFSSGKSCLFPMEPVELVRAIQQYPLRIILFRKTPGKCPPDVLGTTDVFLSPDMCSTIRKAMNSNKELPISSTLQDSYNIRNSDDEDAGFITLFVRLSCFGQSIVTQFKLVNETKSFLFKNSTEDSTFKCDTCVCTPSTETQSSRKTSTEQKREAFGDGNEFNLSSPCGLCNNDNNPVDKPIALACGCSPENKPVLPPCECPTDSDKNPPPINLNWCDAEECENRGVPRDIAERGSQRQPLQQKTPPCCEHCRQSNMSPNKLCDDSRDSKSSSCNSCEMCGKLKKPPCVPCDKCKESKSPPKIPCHHCQQPTSPPCIPCDDCKKSKSPTKVPCSHCQQSMSPTLLPCDHCRQTKPPPKIPCGHCQQSMSSYEGCCEANPPPYPSKQTSKPAQSSCSPCPPHEGSYPARQPLISCDECAASATPSSRCPGEQQAHETWCECGNGSSYDQRDCYPTQCSHQINNYEYNDDTETCYCRPPVYSDMPRPPFSERDEDDIVPVMPVYCSQENIYDPDFDLRKCPAEVYERSEQWKKMFTCDCPSDIRESAEEDSVYPPVRYDTTGALSPAFKGNKITGQIIELHSSPRYDMTGALSTAFNHPPVRYDTTGALSPAYQGGAPGLKFLFQESGYVHEQLHESVSTPGVMQNLPADPAFFFDAIGHTSLSEAMIFGDVTKKKKKRGKCWRPPPKNRRHFVYSWGGTYPGVKVGHRFCLQSSSNVPARMGWLWYPPDPSDQLKPRPGWRPGAVSRSVARVMREVRKAAGCDVESVAAVKKKSDKSLVEDKPQLPPTLHIHRRDGAYYISMHPINLVPEENNVPLQFRIPAHKKDENDDSDSCGCGAAESTTSSELEIEFMAPGVYWPGKETVETQYNNDDLTSDPKLQYVMDVGGKGDSAANESKDSVKEISKGKGKRKEKGGGKDKGAKPGNTKRNSDLQQGKPITRTSVDPEQAPKTIAWDKDDQPTAVGKKR